jgi:hypothetical protein
MKLAAILKSLGTTMLLYLTADSFGQHNSEYFYINQINDQRPNKNIGMVYQSQSIPTAFTLPYQLSAWLKKRLESSFESKENISPYFLNINVTAFNITEKPNQNNSVSGQITFAGNVYITDNQDSTVLFPYHYQSKYTRPSSNTQSVSQQINQQPKMLLATAENWFAKHYANNPLLLRHVHVLATDYHPPTPNPDTLHYTERKLNLADFSPKTYTTGKYAATVFTNMAYQAQVRVSNDTAYLAIVVKNFQLKNMSYIDPNYQNSRVLNHEQLHFDITQLVAERFKNRLMEEALPANDYDSRIQYLYLEYYRMINKLQQLYDAETNHGTNASLQSQWEAQVSQWLAEIRNQNKQKIEKKI